MVCGAVLWFDFVESDRQVREVEGGSRSRARITMKQLILRHSYELSTCMHRTKNQLIISYQKERCDSTENM